ncbi:hypothetical protein ACV22V_32580, partial [Burkholderia sp. AW33-5]
GGCQMEARYREQLHQGVARRDNWTDLQIGGIGQSLGANRQSLTVLHSCNISFPRALSFAGPFGPDNPEGVGTFFCLHRRRATSLATHDCRTFPASITQW